MPASGSILVICTANVCRSPMAEKLLQHALAAEPEPLKSLVVLSAGIAAGRGLPATENSVVALRKVRIDLSGHTSRPLTQELLDDALAVFCMTETHRAMIQLNFERVPANLHLFREFMAGLHDVEIPDPYGQSYSSYEACRDAMVEAVPSLVQYLRGLTQIEAGRKA